MNRFYLIACCLVLLASCTPKPEVHYIKEGKLCYIDTKEGRLWGIGNATAHIIEPAYDTIISIFEGNAYYAGRQGVYRLFDIQGKALCDGAEFVSQPEYCSDYSGGGSQGKYIRAYTTQGIYGVYYVKHWVQWNYYGPFKEFIAGSCGYMFQDNQTGKWGVGKYGDWTLNEKEWFKEDQAMLKPSRDIIIPAQYSKIVNISDYYGLKTHWALGYRDKKDIRWYCYDGSQWHGFDIDGKSIPVNQKELDRALRSKVKRSINRTRKGLPTQRVGIEDASVLIINHSYEK